MPGNQPLKPSYVHFSCPLCLPGGQNVFKGANNGMPSGAYTGYPAQPKAGYPGQPMPVQGYPAGEPFLAPKRKESCCNVQWVCHSHCIMLMKCSYSPKAPTGPEYSSMR